MSEYITVAGIVQFDPRQRQDVVGHAGAKEHRRHKRLGKQRLNFGQRTHAPTVRNPVSMFNEKSDTETGIPEDCSNRSSSKAAASEKPMRTWGGTLRL